ncbi:DsbA family oxidoreductase [Pseudomonas sp. efr-133-TYG-103a]|uniref:DsbA family oxidoreductase n=1 Tax=Pseudomonas sp. efr-133-TYG-103a TaxID=3040308 RepID=UPI002557311E|nr:DsbA family oxidoreductase [Pseudomonas sp. efr-133-TYG-103a]
MKNLDIQITSDFICPWCWIGEANLEQALQTSEMHETTRLLFVPYLLNPDMPVEGKNRKIYRTEKFGSWTRSQAMDAQVTVTGKASGRIFNYDIIDKTPNTVAAHRLIWREQASGNDATRLVNAIFEAYFRDGKDIGDLETLANITGDMGQDRASTLVFLKSDEGREEVLQMAKDAQRRGVRSVPSINIAEHTLSGAQPTTIFSDILRRVQAEDAQE